MSIKTNIPLPVAPLTGPNGQINEVWWRFFLDIFNRTGSGSGNEGTIDPTYSDISPIVIDQSQPNASSFEALFSPVAALASALTETTQGQLPQSDSPVEMVFAPVLATDNPSFANITYSGQLTSLAPVGTPPMVLTSTTKVVNLNSDLLDDGDWASPRPIGTTTPNSAIFTSTINTGSGTFGSITVQSATQMLSSLVSFNNGAGAATGTLTNAPAAGNPTKWIGINDNGTLRYIPAW